MKALRIISVTFLICIFIIGIQSQAPKPPQSEFKLQLNSVLGDMQDKLSDQVEELNEIKGIVGRSSTKAAKLLSKTVQVISYLEQLFEVSSKSTTCPVPGAKPSPKRGFCYLLVTDPILEWSDADAYCQALGGYLIEPLPLDTTLGTDLQNLFPELSTLGSTQIWTDGEIVGSTYVYRNGYVPTAPAFVAGKNRAMTIPPDPTPAIVLETSTTELPFICQFNVTTVFPPFRGADTYDEDDTKIPDRKHMVDVESINEAHHHYNEHGGYHPSEEYSEDFHSMEGVCPVPGAKASFSRGLCYLLVTEPKLSWSDADAYCQARGGYLIEPLPSDATLGTDLVGLFPQLATLGSNIWTDGQIVGSTYVYHNGYVPTTPAFVATKHRAMIIPPTGTPPAIVLETSTTPLPCICQF